MPIRTPLRVGTEAAGENTPSLPGKGLATITLLVLFIVAAGGFAWSYRGYAQATKQLNFLSDPKAQAEQAKKETADLLAKLSKLVVLPSGEDPTVATVTDAATMAKEQPFYKDSHNGDKLVVYAQARKAYLYDPARNILVNVGPIFIDEKSPPAVKQEAAPLSVEIINGSSVAGKANGLVNELKQDPNLNLFPASNANNNDYQGTILVDLTDGTKSEAVASLAKKINANIVTTTPAGEKTSLGEVLIIVGN